MLGACWRVRAVNTSSLLNTFQFRGEGAGHTAVRERPVAFALSRAAVLPFRKADMLLIAILYNHE